MAGFDAGGGGADEAGRGAAYDRLARACLALLREDTPIQSAPIVADNGLLNGTPQLTVRLHGAARRATYAVPKAVQVGRLIFVQAVGPREGELVTWASNYQVTPHGAGLGSGPLGTGRLGE